MLSFILRTARNFGIFTKERDREIVWGDTLHLPPLAIYMYACSIHIEARTKTNFEQQFSILKDEHTCRYKFWTTFVQNGYGRWTLRSYIYWDITLLPQISAFRYHKTTPYIVSWHIQQSTYWHVWCFVGKLMYGPANIYLVWEFSGKNFSPKWGVSLHKLSKFSNCDCQDVCYIGRQRGRLLNTDGKLSRCLSFSRAKWTIVAIGSPICNLLLWGQTRNLSVW
jgi:hypothetical protein